MARPSTKWTLSLRQGRVSHKGGVVHAQSSIYYGLWLVNCLLKNALEEVGKRAQDYQMPGIGYFRALNTLVSPL